MPAVVETSPAINELIQWIRDHAPAGRRLLVPVSGGSDSALVLWLCAQALPGQVMGVYAGTRMREEAWFTGVAEIRKLRVDYSGKNPEVQRWAHFLELSLAEGMVLVGARNRTEDVLGTFSMASRVASFLPIVGLWKHEVMELCAQIGAPETVTTSSQEADPACGRPVALAALPFRYVDAFLQAKLGLDPIHSLDDLSAEQAAYLESLYQAGAFKADLPTRGRTIHLHS